MDAFIEDIINLFRSVPIIPIIIAFSLLKRFIGKKPESHTNTEQPRQPNPAPAPDDGYGSTRYSSFDDVKQERKTIDPSINPVPVGTMYGGEYGTTKFGFDESDWDSEFDKKWGDKRNDSPTIHVG